MKHKLSVFYLGLTVLLTLAAVGPGARAQSPNRAGLLVRFGDGTVITRCVEFGEAEISGYDLLQRSGLAVVAAFDSGAGAAICKIEHEGCPASDCFCASPPDFWSYWLMASGQWQFAPLGSSSRTVRNGDIDAWSWGPGTAAGGTEPPMMSFDQICAPPATDTPLPPTETPTVQPSPTPLPPTATPIPPSPTPALPTPTPEPLVWFRLDQNPVQAGNCTMVRWDTSGLQELALDGEGVAANGSRQVCPVAHQTFTLKVLTNDGDEQTHSLTLGVTGDAPATQAAPTEVVAQNVEATLPPSTPTPLPLTPTAPPTPQVETQSLVGQGGPVATETSPAMTETSPVTLIAEPSPGPQVEPISVSVTRPAPESTPQATGETEIAWVSVSDDGQAIPFKRGADSATTTSQQATQIPAKTLSYVLFGALVTILAGVLVGVRVLQRQ
jgi:hypothetical protein